MMDHSSPQALDSTSSPVPPQRRQRKSARPIRIASRTSSPNQGRAPSAADARHPGRDVVTGGIARINSKYGFAGAVPANISQRTAASNHSHAIFSDQL